MELVTQITKPVQTAKTERDPAPLQTIPEPKPSSSNSQKSAQTHMEQSLANNANQVHN